MEWILKRFDQLSLDELYEILRLRVRVFVVEQNCAYEEIDGIDRDSLHLFGCRDGEILAYLRLYRKAGEQDTVQAGRIVTAIRGEGLGAELLTRGIRAARDELHAGEIYIEAQCQAQGFYTRDGFSAVSEPFLEDGIPHIRMRLSLEGRITAK